MTTSSVQVSTSTSVTDAITLAERYDAVHAQTEALCEPLDVEDYVVSSDA